MDWLWKSPAKTIEHLNELTINRSLSSPLDQPESNENKSLHFQLENPVRISDKEETKIPHPENIPDTQHGNTFCESDLQHNLPISEYLLPREMSCREAFDSAFYCTSLGGAFNHLYRYGTARSCSEHWNKFWFCMRTRTYSDETKEKSIQEYYRNIEKAKYGKHGTSSEDVWRTRDSLVEKGTAFRSDEGEWNGTDEEWRAAVLETRKRFIEAREASKKSSKTT